MPEVSPERKSKKPIILDAVNTDSARLTPVHPPLKTTIIGKPGATAADFRALIAKARAKKPQ